MKLYLIRHAESVGNKKGNLTSTTDFALTEKGKMQAQRAGNVLKKEIGEAQAVAFCSPLLRAKQTLEEILNCMERKDIKISEASSLKEMDLGILEGLGFDEQARRYPEIDLGRRLSALCAPGGESYQDMKRRVQHFLDSCSAQLGEAENILIVSHGITLRVLTNLLLKRPDEDVDLLNWMENTALTVLNFNEQQGLFCVERLNDYAHLKELKTDSYPDWGIFAEPEAYLLKGKKET